MKKYFQLFSIALLGIAIPLLAMDLNRGLSDLALRFNDLAGRLGGKVGGGEGVQPVYKPKKPKIAALMIDVQNDFMQASLPGGKDGSLAVSDTKQPYPTAIKGLNDYLRSELGAILASADD